jgi:hypothetical protein
MLRTRLRAPSGWTDACILNVSSRGLMINAGAGPAEGSTIELWHGEHLIVATVVWRNGAKAGLQAEERVPIEEILAMGRAPALRLTAGEWPRIDRRKKSRAAPDSRVRGRAIEFAGIAVIAASLAFGALSMIEAAFARPLVYVHSALGG